MKRTDKKGLDMPKKIKVAVSGGFDPVHVGHIRLFKEAKALGDILIVILNNNHWLTQKKGYFFMDEQERKEILMSIQYVDEVILTTHQANDSRIDVCQELEFIKPDIFANGGDRHATNIPEYETCQKINCNMQFNVGGGKQQSSSWLTNKIKSQDTLIK